jgi:hypothetical protein
VIRVRRAALAVVASGVAVIALSGGACQPRQQTQPEPQVSFAPELPLRSRGDDPLDRRAYAPVPSGLSVVGVAFVDADQGYALFQRCAQGQSCQAALALTLDGGNSWVSRKLPFTPDGPVAMHLGRGDVLVLRADPLGWFVSRDSGRTFEQRPMSPSPPEINLAGGQFAYRCPGDASACPSPRVLEIGADGREQPLPTSPPVTDPVVAEGGDERIWAAGSVGGAANQLAVVVSADRGKSWSAAGTVRRQQEVAGEVTLAVSGSGTDVWVVGGGYGARRTSEGSWVDLSAVREIDGLRASVALGDGVLLLAGNRGTSTVSADKWVPNAPPEVFDLRDLGNGVVQGYVRGQIDSVWLCRCTSGAQEWIRVSVSAP